MTDSSSKIRHDFRKSGFLWPTRTPLKEFNNLTDAKLNMYSSREFLLWKIETLKLWNIFLVRGRKNEKFNLILKNISARQKALEFQLQIKIE